MFFFAECNTKYGQLMSRLELKTQSQKEIKERLDQEANTKLASLKQHYKFLKNEFEDFKEECLRAAAVQMDTLNNIRKVQKCGVITTTMATDQK